MKVKKKVIFLDLNMYNQYYKNIKRFVLNYLWQYFNLNREAIFIKLVLFIKLVNKLLPIIITNKSVVY